MKRLGTFWGVALTLMLGIYGLLSACPARAQVDQGGQPALSQDWTIRVGLWFAQSNSARNKMGSSVGFSGHVERRVYAGVNYDLLIGIGYDGWDTVYAVPITINLIAYQHNLRYGLGTGYAFGKRVDGRGTSGPLLDLILGYQLTHTTNPLSLDLRYYFISGSDNELDGYSLTLGYRF